MRKVLVLIVLLFATVFAATAANVAASADITLDTRTQGASTLAVETEIDSRGLTFDVSGEILLNTKKRLATLLFIR